MLLGASWAVTRDLMDEVAPLKISERWWAKASCANLDEQSTRKRICNAIHYWNLSSSCLFAGGIEGYF